MTVEEIARELGLEVRAGNGLEKTVRRGYCGDLLSDVMARANERDIWITIQTHQNIVAVAVLANLSAVIIAGGREPHEDTLERAKRDGIPILCTRDSSFEVAGRLHRILDT
ncbi:MAG: DRTGG domain-containing protein [Bacillota bacterium]